MRTKSTSTAASSGGCWPRSSRRWRTSRSAWCGRGEPTTPSGGSAATWSSGVVVDGRLSGLVDWGSACGGDPAVDVQVVWSPLFTEVARARFLDVVGADDATVARSRGAAINQACAALPYYLHTYPLIVERSRHKLRALGIEVRETS